MIITYSDVMATLDSDYPPEPLRALVGDGLDPADPATLEIVLALPREDARRVLSRLLTAADVVAWAGASADRARGYAAATHYAAHYAAAARDAAYAAPYAAHYAAHGARYAAVAARYAADAARYAARYAAVAARRAQDAARNAGDTSTAGADHEHKTACQHALDLLAGDPQ